MIVEIEGLKKIYDGKQRVVAVDGIDLQVRDTRFQPFSTADCGSESRGPVEVVTGPDFSVACRRQTP